MDVDGGSLEIDAWDEHGAPLPMHAPRVGDFGTVPVTGAERFAPPPPKTDAERVAAAAGALAEGDGRTAERLLEGLEKTAPPDVALLYARAVETARDLSSVERSERGRAAYPRGLEAWPTAWRPSLRTRCSQASGAGEGDARIEILRDLDAFRAKADAETLPLLDAFDALTSAREHLYDRAHGAFERARATLGKTSLWADVGKIAVERVGAEHAAYACSPEAPKSRRTVDCYSALFEMGDLAGSQRELQRLREVRGGDAFFLPLTLKDAVVRGDANQSARTLEAMNPSEVSLSEVYAVGVLVSSPDPTGRLHDAMTLARDAPQAWPPLLRALGDDPTRPFAGIAERLRREDLDHPILESAATAVLAHTESYDVDEIGLVHALLFDLRRVSGTADVEENAQAEPPELLGSIDDARPPPANLEAGRAGHRAGSDSSRVAGARGSVATRGGRHRGGRLRRLGLAERSRGHRLRHAGPAPGAHERPRRHDPDRVSDEAGSGRFALEPSLAGKTHGDEGPGQDHLHVQCGRATSASRGGGDAEDGSFG